MNRKDHPSRARRMACWFPLTSSGASLLIGAGVLLWWTHRLAHDHVIRVVAWASLALTVLAAILGWALGRHQRRRIAKSLASARLVCGDKLPDAGGLLRIHYLQPRTDESNRVIRRGQFSSIHFRLSDPLDLFSLKHVVHDTDLRVMPGLARPATAWQLPPEIAAGEEWSARGKPEGDMLEIGEYRRGDPLRFVLWKISARRGTTSLYVRRPETVGDSKLAFYFTAGPEDDRTAELLHFMIREDLIHPTDLLVINTDHEDASTAAGEEGLHRLAASGNAPPAEAQARFTRFMDEAHRRRISACLVFLPAPNAEQVMKSFPESDLPIHFIAAVQATEAISEARASGHNLQFIPVEPINRA